MPIQVCDCGSHSLNIFLEEAESRIASVAEEATSAIVAADLGAIVMIVAMIYAQFLGRATELALRIGKQFENL